MPDPAPPDSGTIDITNIVESLRQSFVTWAVAYVYGEELLVPGLGGFVALPIIADVDRAIIKYVIDALSKSGIMLAFFENTAIRKAGQADTYVKSVEAKNNLPTTASDEDYEKLERAEMLAFRNFVAVSN